MKTMGMPVILLIGTKIGYHSNVPWAIMKRSHWSHPYEYLSGKFGEDWSGTFRDKRSPLSKGTVKMKESNFSTFYNHRHAIARLGIWTSNMHVHTCIYDSDTSFMPALLLCSLFAVAKYLVWAHLDVNRAFGLRPTNLLSHCMLCFPLTAVQAYCKSDLWYVLGYATCMSYPVWLTVCRLTPYRN